MESQDLGKASQPAYRAGSPPYKQALSCFVVKTANLVISRCCFAEHGTELFLSACLTCSMPVLPRPIKFEALLLPSVVELPNRELKI